MYSIFFCLLGMARRLKGLTEKEIEFFMNLSDSELEYEDFEEDDCLQNEEETLVKIPEIKRNGNLFECITEDPVELENIFPEFDDGADNSAKVNDSIQSQLDKLLSTEDEVVFDLIDFEVGELLNEGEADILAVGEFECCSSNNLHDKHDNEVDAVEGDDVPSHMEYAKELEHLDEPYPFKFSDKKKVVFEKN